MKEHRVWVVLGILVVLGLLGLMIGLGQPKMRGVAQFPSPLQTPTPVTIEPTPVDQSTPTPTAPSEDWPTLTPYPTEMVPPVPTPLPTPVVTPIPVAEPPFIPGLEDAVPQPFHIILREGNTVWMVNSDGSDKRFLIDTEDRAGLYLGHYPVQGIEGPPLRWGSVSPDGTRVALVVTDLWKPEYKGQPFGWNIYILDIETGEFRFLVEGREPVWSPDGTRLAYVRGGGLWVVDVKFGEGKELFSVEEGYWVIDVTWSPDGQRIAFLHQEASPGGIPEMLVAKADGNEELVQLIPSTVWPFGGAAWSYEGKRIFYVYAAKEPTALHFYDLWMIDTEKRTTVQLTTHTIVLSFRLHPKDRSYIVFAGTRPYEQSESSYNLWLISSDGTELHRLTSDPIDDLDPHWSPDGTEIVFRRSNEGIWVLNLIDGRLRQIYVGPADFEVTR